MVHSYGCNSWFPAIFLAFGATSPNPFGIFQSAVEWSMQWNSPRMHVFAIAHLYPAQAQFIVDLLCVTTRIRNQFIFVVTISNFSIYAAFSILWPNFFLHFCRVPSTSSFTVHPNQHCCCLYVCGSWLCILNVIVLLCFFPFKRVRACARVCWKAEILSRTGLNI